MANLFDQFDSVAPENVFDQFDAAPKERRDQSYVAGLARTALGQGTLLGLGDELAAAGRAIATDETYGEALEDERAKIEQFREDNPKTALVGELVGSIATPGVGLAVGALKPAAKFGGRVAQGAKLGAGFGAGYGAASAEGGDGTLLEQAGNRLSGAVQGGGFGAVIGGAVPIVGGAAGAALRKTRDLTAPTVARHREGLDAAADEIMATRLRNAGETTQSLRDRFAEADRVGTFYGGGKSASVTDSPLALADASPALAKLGGSSVRSSDEAYVRADAFLNSRQTGLRPATEGGRRALDDAGVATRNPLERGAVSEPAGQYERIKDALTRAMTLEDKDFHQFGKNAYRTEQTMMAALKAKADQLYGTARDASQNFNIQPVIEPVIRKFSEQMAYSPVGEASIIRNALRQFTTGNGNLVTSLDGFDKAKRAIDGMIGRFQTNGDKNTVRILTGIKNEMIDAVDAIPSQGIGEKYREARNYFSTQMEMKDAIDLGRKAFTENSDVVVDQVRGMTHGQKKLFRLGLIESFENNLGRKKRTNDVTQVFETPRIQELLSEIIPRTETATGRAKAGAVYADRPQRFGDFVANEKAMTRTGNKVLGNSATAERVADDAKFTRQGLSQMFNALRMSGGVTGIAIESATAGLNRIFGMREDVAATIAKRLFNANPNAREYALQKIEQAYGKQKLPAFLDYMSRVSLATTTGVAGQVGQEAAPTAPAR